MSYEKALEAAGAKVVAFESFGSYQGDWWAKVRFNRKTRWVHGYYGSCSGCDAFEAELGDFWGEHIDGQYVYAEDKRHPRHAEYAARLKAFGANYLEELLTQEEAEKEASRNVDWDLDAGNALAWIVQNRLTNLADATKETP